MMKGKYPIVLDPVSDDMFWKARVNIEILKAQYYGQAWSGQVGYKSLAEQLGDDTRHCIVKEKAHKKKKESDQVDV